MERNDIAAVLDEIATLLELTGENPFKIRAYSSGARVLEGLAEDLDVLIAEGRLADVPGLGEALVEKITVLRRDGALPFHQKLRASVPAGLLEVLQIPGLGPKKVRALWKELGVEDLAKLKEVCEAGAVADARAKGAETTGVAEHATDANVLAGGRRGYGESQNAGRQRGERKLPE